jgi:hypothetical protein
MCICGSIFLSKSATVWLLFRRQCLDNPRILVRGDARPSSLLACRARPGIASFRPQSHGLPLALAGKYEAHAAGAFLVNLGFKLTFVLEGHSERGKT